MFIQGETWLHYTQKQVVSYVTMPASLQVSLNISVICSVRASGVGVGICSMVFHHVVKVNFCIFNHRMCAQEYFEMDHAEPVPNVDVQKPSHHVFYLPMHDACICTCWTSILDGNAGRQCWTAMLDGNASAHAPCHTLCYYRGCGTGVSLLQQV